jgi:uncharacterized lipoprotein YddW (UPF0748 family)
MRWCTVGLLTLVVAMSTPLHGQEEEPAMSEARAIWAHLYMLDADPEKGKQQAEEWADRWARANLNIVYPWAESTYLAAVDEQEPSVPQAKWDALGVLTRACVERGLQVHLWYSFTYYKGGSSPEFRQNPAWRAVRIDELVPDPQTGKVHEPWWSDVCPMHPDARAYEIELIMKALDRYPEMTGVQIEEPGFGYRGNCFCELCQEVFQKVYGFDQKEKPDGPEATELKTLGTTAFARELRERMLARDPKLVLTYNGGYDWRGERVLGRDWARWARYGWMDGYAAQIYVTEPDMLKERAAVTISDLGRDTDVYVGINISPPAIRPERLSQGQLATMVETIREAGAQGICFFHAGLFTDQDAQALAQGPFRDKAAPPTPRRLRE